MSHYGASFLPNAKMLRMLKKPCKSETLSLYRLSLVKLAINVNEKRKTINGDDLLWAMSTLGFINIMIPSVFDEVRNPLKAKIAMIRRKEETRCEKSLSLGNCTMLLFNLRPYVLYKRIYK